MSRKLSQKMFTIIALAGLFAILLASLALGAPAGFAASYAPAALAAAPAKVTFSTSGLPVGISLTIYGTHTNNGGKDPIPYSVTFDSPGPSADVSSEPGSLVYFDFPANIPVVDGTYTLLSTSVESPFALGGSGSTTNVTATYTACSSITFDTQPANVSAELEAPATFSVVVTGLLPKYQWYRNGEEIPGAEGSSYTIPSLSWSDDGDYFEVVVTNGCSSATSNAGTLTVTKKSQEITFDQPSSPQVYGATFSVSPASNSGLEVEVNASGSCSYAAGEVTITSGTGDCTLTASQTGDANYSAATNVSWTIAAAKADQTITFIQPSSPQTFGDKFSVNPTSNSGLPVSMNASGSCSYAAGEVTMTSGTGDCTLTASQAGDGNFNPATPVVWTIAAAKADQTITFAQPASPADYGSQFTVSPSANSGLVVSLNASGGCSNTVFTVTMTSSTAACTLTASQAGNANYNPASDVTWTVEAIKANQAITFAQPASPADYGSQFTVSPSASSGLAVALVASGGCSKTGSTVTMTSSSVACTLTASQAGNANYNAAPEVVRTVGAVKANQAITFAQPPSPVSVGSSFDISPTSGSSLTVSVTATGACSLIGNTVTASLLPGTCTLTASQAGNANYNPALDVVRTVAVTLKAGKIFIPILYSR